MTEEQVYAALRNVIDPELGINVVDLGLIYKVQVADDRVYVQMTMTSAACPMHAHLTRMAESEIRARSGAAKVHVDVVYEPEWTPDLMSDDARHMLGWG